MYQHNNFAKINVAFAEKRKICSDSIKLSTIKPNCIEKRKSYQRFSRETTAFELFIWGSEDYSLNTWTQNFFIMLLVIQFRSSRHLIYVHLIKSKIIHLYNYYMIFSVTDSKFGLLICDSYIKGLWDGFTSLIHR